MRHGTSNRRPRSRNNNNGNRGKGGNNRTKVFDSNGPEVRIRGTAHQILDKYQALAKDAKSSGDYVLNESYLQHAEHYQRMIVEWDEQAAQQQAQNAPKEKTYKKDHQADGNKKAQNDDLALPSSILGDEVKVESKDVRALENA